MTRWVDIRNSSRGGERVIRARWCESFGCRLRGLTFRRELPERRGLLLVQGEENKAGAAIHMWGVLFPLGVAWLDSHRRVVECRLARPWRLYLPASPAMYILEGPPSMLDLLGIGDSMEFIDEAG